MSEPIIEFWRKIAAVFHRRRLEQELADEMEFHLSMKRQKLAGEGAGDATAHARSDFGSVEKWKDNCRDVHRFRFLEAVVQDLSFSFRMMRRSPAFTAVALVTLALAIGANTAVFSLLNALLLRPLAVPQAEQLVMLRIQPDDYGYSFCYPLFRYFERHHDAFSSVFAFSSHTFQVRGSDGTEEVPGSMVSGEYFASLRVPPQLGRWLTTADDRKGGGSDGPVAVVSHRFWERSLGGSATAVGRKLILDNVAFTVAGVMPEKFTGAAVGDRPEIFIPIALEPLVDAPYDDTDSGWYAWWIRIGARRRDGVSPEQADAFLRSISQAAITRSIPGAWVFDGHKGSELHFAAEPGATGFCYVRLRFKKPLMALMILVSFVLLIASLNLASLMMARSSAREREIATRFALGASRARLVQQFLTESLVLAAGGTVLGFALAPLAGRALLAFVSSRNNPVHLDVTPDARVLAFTALVAGLATVLTGLSPALRSTGRRSLHNRIPERRQTWPRLLLAVEVALSLVLVAGAGLLGSSLVRLYQEPAGFEPRGLLMLPLDTNKQRRDGNELIQFHRDFSDSLTRAPGVESVGLTAFTPMSSSLMRGGVRAKGRPWQDLHWNRVGPDYFHTMRTPLVAGREFRWTDNDASRRVVILNRSAVRRLFADQDALGQLVYDMSKGAKSAMEVVGIVADTKYMSLRETAPPTYYVPITQDVKDRPSFTAVVRLNGHAGPVISAARAIVKQLAPEVPVPAAFSMEIQIAESISTERLMATLALFFAAAALLITGIGLYGTLSYSTARRTGEIGIRMALGAHQRQVIALVLKENAAIAIGGCVAGLTGSLAASRLIAGFLYGTSPRSPLVLATSVAALAAIAAVASLIPAWRASRIDPITAIRYE